MREEEISEEERKAIEILDRASQGIAQIDKIINELPDDKPLFTFHPEGFSDFPVSKSVKIAGYRKQQEMKKDNAIEEVEKIMKSSGPVDRDKIFARLNKWVSPDKNLDLSVEQDRAMQILKNRKIDLDKD